MISYIICLRVTETSICNVTACIIHKSNISSTGVYPETKAEMTLAVLLRGACHRSILYNLISFQPLSKIISHLPDIFDREFDVYITLN